MKSKASIIRDIKARWFEIVMRAIQRGATKAPMARLPKKDVRILGESQKVNKGVKKNVLTAVIYLTPADSAGIVNLCPDSTPECRLSCLAHWSGKMGLSDSQNARLWKTTLFLGAPKLFRALLDKEIEGHIKSAKKKDMIPAVRFDGSSDTGWGLRLSKAHSECMFYDYTKSYTRAIKNLRESNPNYHLTFSFSGRNLFEARSVLKNGGNVSVVFATRKDAELPKTWEGFKVIDGDETDVRFMDDFASVVGLRLKGNNFNQQKERAGCFVVEPKAEAPTPIEV